jgi:hypothetical protein
VVAGSFRGSPAAACWDTESGGSPDRIGSATNLALRGRYVPENTDTQLASGCSCQVSGRTRPLFCLDLYEGFDVDPLAVLAEPAKVRQEYREASK